MEDRISGTCTCVVCVISFTPTQYCFTCSKCFNHCPCPEHESRVECPGCHNRLTRDQLCPECGLCHACCDEHNRLVAFQTGI